MSARVEGVVLFVKPYQLFRLTGEPHPVLISERYPTPLGDYLHVDCGQATFRHKGRAISVELAEEIFRPYVAIAYDPELGKGARAWATLVDNRYLYGMWIEVTGTVRFVGSDPNVYVDPARMKQHRGEMELPITRINPWILVIDAEVMELEFRLTHAEDPDIERTV